MLRCLTIWFAVGLIVSHAAMAGVRGASSPLASPATGAWTEVIPSSAFKAVTPTRAEMEAFRQDGPSLWGVTGPYPNVLGAWNSVSFDAKRGLIYAHGGGHTNYGGNEIYRADIAARTWERITDPSPYLGEVIAQGKGGKDYRLPLDGPPSTHTYSGILYNPARDSIMVLGTGVPYTQPGVRLSYPPMPYLYDFDTATKKWTKYPKPIGVNKGFSVYVPKYKKTYSIGYSGHVLVVDDDLNTSWIKVWKKADQHTAVYDAQRDVVWSVQHQDAFFQWSVSDDALRFSQSIAVPQDVQAVMGWAPGIAMRNGLIWFYGGGELVTFDPDHNQWQILRSDAPPSERVYSKFHYWPQRDLFVFVSDSGGVYLFDPTKAKGTVVDTNAKRAAIGGAEFTSIADAVKAADDGDTITIYPGTYREGVRINQNNLTIKAEGVVIDGGVYGAKATFVQYGDDLTIEGIEAKNLAVGGQNAALVRMEPSANNLTLRSVYVHDSQSGAAVTGKGTGDVVVEDSRIERTGYGGQAHGIYVGTGANRLIIRRSEFVEGIRLGHLVKSRAPVTIIEDSTLDGRDGNHSRVIDIPCGGRVEIRRSVLRQSPNSDNRDLIAIAVEGCQLPRSTLVLEDTRWTATKPRARFLTTRQTVDIRCHGVNEFKGVDDPCD